MTKAPENVPKELDAIADVLLRYKAKPKSAPGKKCKKRAAKIAKDAKDAKPGLGFR